MGCSMARTMVHATPELCTLEMTVHRIMSLWTDGFVPLCQFLLNLQDEWGSVNPEGVPSCFPKLSNGSIRESMSNVRIGCGFKRIALRAFLVGRSIISMLAVGQCRSTLWTWCRKCCSCAAFDLTVGGLWMHPRRSWWKHAWKGSAYCPSTCWVLTVKRWHCCLQSNGGITGGAAETGWKWMNPHNFHNSLSAPTLGFIAWRGFTNRIIQHFLCPVD